MASPQSEEDSPQSLFQADGTVATDAPEPGPGVTVASPEGERRFNLMLGWGACLTAAVIGIFQLGRSTIETVVLVLALAVLCWGLWMMTSVVEPKVRMARRRAYLPFLGGAVTGAVIGIALVFALAGSFTSRIWAGPLFIVVCSFIGAMVGRHMTRHLDREQVTAAIDYPPPPVDATTPPVAPTRSFEPPARVVPEQPAPAPDPVPVGPVITATDFTPPPLP